MEKDVPAQKNIPQKEREKEPLDNQKLLIPDKLKEQIVGKVKDHIKSVCDVTDPENISADDKMKMLVYLAIKECVDILNDQFIELTKRNDELLLMTTQLIDLNKTANKECNMLRNKEIDRSKVEQNMYKINILLGESDRELSDLADSTMNRVSNFNNHLMCNNVNVIQTPSKSIKIYATKKDLEEFRKYFSQL